MPLRPQRLHHRLHNRLPTPPALRAVSIRMTTHAPRIPVLLHKWHLRRERVAALRAEEVTRVPLRSAGEDHLALDGRFAGFAARAEELVVV